LPFEPQRSKPISFSHGPTQTQSFGFGLSEFDFKIFERSE
jgi:hypothetical protein